jgi:ribonuclease HII
MGIIIGMDEAGYGPNLGPLVIGTTAWQFHGAPGDTNLWELLADVVSQKAPRKGNTRLHVADSKDVYNPSRGIRSLERTVLAVLRAIGHNPRTFSGLHKLLITTEPESEPWFDENDAQLPLAADEDEIAKAATNFKACLGRNGIRISHIRCDVVLTRRFNSMVRDHDSKGIALSRTSINLLRSVWDPDSAEKTRVIADKHGGRNRYDELLEDAIEDRMIFRLQEGRERSVYRVNKTELVFRTKAEQHLPVALASMVAKYVREVSMELFNQYWLRHIPNLKPTKGYPLDASRFRKAIAETAIRLGLEEDAYWRSR